MNWVETCLMNNPIRAAFQTFVEAPLLERLGGRTEGMRVLEVGCGRGVGIEIILRRFGAQFVHALDNDLAMVSMARRRLKEQAGVKVEFGDVTAIKAEDKSFDAVFDFAALHHVNDWQAAVSEIGRVLKPGGRFFFEECTDRALNRWSYRTFMDHPLKNRFSALGFIQELEKQGLVVGSDFVERHGGDFVFGVALNQRSIK